MISRHAQDQRLIDAHGALRRAGDVQFDMGPAAGPPPTPPWLKALNAWLNEALKPVGRFFDAIWDWLAPAFRPIGRLLRWISSHMPDAPYARIFLWGVIACFAALLLWIVYDRLRHGVWRMPRLRRAKQGVSSEEEADWTPGAAPARAWLKEADALAAQGLYAEAVHHLLLRSVEDLGRRRPQMVRPALTSRDLARAEAIPPAPRRLFSEIAAVVERSLFGGRPVGGAEWTQCRAAYADFAQSRTWQR